MSKLSSFLLRKVGWDMRLLKVDHSRIEICDGCWIYRVPDLLDLSVWCMIQSETERSFDLGNWSLCLICSKNRRSVKASQGILALPPPHTHTWLAYNYSTNWFPLDKRIYDENLRGDRRRTEGHVKVTIWRTLLGSREWGLRKIWQRRRRRFSPGQEAFLLAAEA